MFKDYISKISSALFTNSSKKIYIITFIMFGILIIWAFLGRILKSDEENKQQIIENNTSLYKPQETIVSGRDVKETEYKEDEELINKFVESCNNGNIEEAYNMLSNDCKEIIFNDSQENFEKNYYNEVFKTNRECNIQSWISEKDYNTYQVRMIDDIMSTGDYSNSSNYQDYITIVKDGENQYLNIKEFLYKKDVEAKTEVDGIEISVENEIRYLNYLEYWFSVKNNTDKAILLDTLKKASDTMCIELTENKIRHCNPGKLTKVDLTIDSYMTKKIKIKYNEIAGTDNVTKKIIFKDIIKDYEEYMKDKQNYTERIEANIKF